MENGTKNIIIDESFYSLHLKITAPHTLSTVEASVSVSDLVLIGLVIYVAFSCENLYL